ncbi:hypothetical protein GN956_G24974 [Arapaima gigas]
MAFLLGNPSKHLHLLSFAAAQLQALVPNLPTARLVGKQDFRRNLEPDFSAVSPSARCLTVSLSRPFHEVLMSVCGLGNPVPAVHG